MNIFFRTGHQAVPHTISTMDNCRISWGRVVGVGKQYIIETQPLIYAGGKLGLGVSEKKAVTSITVTPKVGDWVSVHWGYVCAVLNRRELTLLKKYTTQALAATTNIA